MSSILISELAPDFLIQGLGLHQDETQAFVGKVSGQEVQLLFSIDDLQPGQGDKKVFCVGMAEKSPHYRRGDVLMTGSDDLLDRAFQVMDEIEQRGVVVNLTPSEDPTQLFLSQEQMECFVRERKSQKNSFLCLWMVGPLELEEKAKLVALLRKVLT